MVYLCIKFNLRVMKQKELFEGGKKKPFMKPEFHVIELNGTDIICTSGEAPDFGEGDGPVWS